MAEGKPVDIKPPEIVGMPAVGATLRCLEGEWSGLPTPVPRYEWVQEGNSTPIGTGETYVVKLADVKHNVKCIVTEQNEDTRFRAAVDARRDADILILARTDARAVHGFDEALERCRDFEAEGADIIFLEAPENEILRCAASASDAQALHG